MKTRQEQRAEATKRLILETAGTLFAERGFEAVTMREIAKGAGCSHTTIYLYFKDKEALLQALSAGPLEELYGRLEAELQRSTQTPQERLRAVMGVFLQFCLVHRSMYELLFLARASRVDEQEPELGVQRQRNALFALLQRAVGEALGRPVSEEERLAYARVCFFTLHGIVGTYRQSAEPFEALLARLEPTFALAVDVLVAGLQQTTFRGDEHNEG